MATYYYLRTSVDPWCVRVPARREDGEIEIVQLLNHSDADFNLSNPCTAATLREARTLVQNFFRFDGTTKKARLYNPSRVTVRFVN